MPVVLAAVWFSPYTTLAFAALAALLAFLEYATIAAALGANVPRVLCATAVVAGCVAVAEPAVRIDVILMTAMILIGSLAVASGQPSPAILRDAAASLFPVLYIGMPLGALAAVRLTPDGRLAVLLLMATIVVSDSAQYYTGRAFGRRPLSPTISPKKTVEGAIGGFLFGAAAMIAGGLYVFPDADRLMLGLVGLSIPALGIVGDLFESLLKRSAGIKDSGTLIPGHGGVLDRIDSWLFAAPLYYVFVVHLQYL